MKTISLLRKSLAFTALQFEWHMKQAKQDLCAAHSRRFAKYHIGKARMWYEQKKKIQRQIAEYVNA